MTDVAIFGVASMIKVRCFYTYSGSTLSKLARWATQGPWGHMGIVFEHADGAQEAFEARSQEGFAGPFPLAVTIKYIIN